jgi:hypothetical protein
LVVDSILERGGAVPHIEVRTIDGQAFDYATIWQRKNLVLVALPASRTDAAYLTELSARAPEFSTRNTALVLTLDPVSGLPPAGVIIADRWGEIVHVAAASDASNLPGADDLLEWIDYLERRCPECEGESK